ncbi:MAG TPA: helix-turn-helix transcriptional regulator [Candidatus Angelobacter sp.]|nr:helix-turn-helix transcriptional regulator [Candidatus Angelobacter sp.]
MPPTEKKQPGGSTLGEHLSLLRAATGLTLRQVEEATDKEVSNAYLSQLEKDKISKPSPNILHALAGVYKTSYEDLMERAGYFGSGLSSNKRRAQVATFAVENLTPEEENALLKYLAFIREQRRK